MKQKHCLMCFYLFVFRFFFPPQSNTAIIGLNTSPIGKSSDNDIF